MKYTSPSFLGFMYPHFGTTDLNFLQLAILLAYFPLLGSTFDEYEEQHDTEEASFT